MTSPAPIPDLGKIDVIAPNFKRRHSGVTSTVIRLVPMQARQIAIAACAPDLPPEVPVVSPLSPLFMSRRGPSGPRVWHARRNVEMIAGLALKHLARKQLKLVFTSAAQRRHTALTRWLIRRVDAIVATSARSARYLERDALVIQHGIDCTQFEPVADRAALRQSLDLPADGPLVGCFGRIRPQKGNDLFVRAMIRVLSGLPNGHALMMGRATEDNRAFLEGLKTEVAAAGLSGRILFRDEVPITQLAAHFQALDLYVAPQRWEGFGLTPLEAMACGTPVVATRVGAFEDLIADGVTGHLVEVGDVDAIASHVRGLITNTGQRATFGSAARRHVVAQFSIEREATALVELYRSLLDD